MIFMAGAYFEVEVMEKEKPELIERLAKVNVDYTSSLLLTK